MIPLKNLQAAKDQNTVLFCCGNPGREDDALGYYFYQQWQKFSFPSIQCFYDMQLQIEHIEDLYHCQQVIFVDADVSISQPYEFSKLCAAKDQSYSSHAMSPQALLYAFKMTYQRQPPAAFILSIQGINFQLGEKLSQLAEQNLNLANEFMRHQLLV